MSGDPPGQTPASRTVLVVEDEFYLADDLRRSLVDQGIEVVGPVNSLQRARQAMHDPHVDFAVLDVNLKGELIFPLCDELRERGVPFCFTTGYDAAMIPAEYRDVERWEKPFSAQQLAAAIKNPDRRMDPPPVRMTDSHTTG